MSDDRFHLLKDPSDLSVLSNASTFVGSASPQAPPRHRPGYTRVLSEASGDVEEGRDAKDEEGEDIADTFHKHKADHGLGIATGPKPPPRERHVSIQSVPRVPVGAKGPPGSSAPGSSEPLISPPSTFANFSGNTAYEGAGSQFDSNAGAKGHFNNPSVSSLNSSFHQPYEFRDTDRLNKGRTAASVKSAYDNDFHPQEACPSHKKHHRGRANWLAICLIVLSIFSTVFSGIYLGIALRGPRYGRKISAHGAITFSTASVLTALFAKLIELSFVTVFVAFLGQVLSRRAFTRQSRGITLAEMNMRSWIMQPGTMLTHWETVRYAALSFLGIISLLAAVVAMLYTTAAEALVQPQLKFGPWESKLMQGAVMTQWANPKYLATHCPTPIRNDEEFGGSTCLQIEHAAMGYHNYKRYMNFWSDQADAGNGTTDLRTRPQGFGLLHENTSITASWVEVKNMTEVSEKFGGRIINNVSLAMPHAGVFQAAIDPRNGIVQPEELNGQGVYSLRASVPSPVIHVLCANMQRDELAPLVYETWPNANKTVIVPPWPSSIDFGPLNKYEIKTKVDDVFGWGPQYKQSPPFFSKFPKEYNTILNNTFDYGRDSLYLLGKGGPLQGDKYVLCQLKGTLTPYCSTRYNATQGGGTMEALCEEKHDKMQYINSMWNASSGYSSVSLDYPNVLTEWGNSLSLNAGVNDANASNARLLTELILKEPKLNPALPSPAEALAVMAGCTLLQATENSPFVEFWNYSLPVLEKPQYQYFNASLRAQQYASGGVYQYQRGFYIVLFVVFITNVVVLIYFLCHKGLVTDFSEPPNLFSLAVNSPPSQHLAGSCGGGPQGEQYKVNWFVNTEGEHLFMASEEPPEQKVRHRHLSSRERVHAENGFEMASPMSAIYSKFAKRKSGL